MVASSAGLAHVAAVGESQTVAILAGRRTWRRVNKNRITDSWIEQLQLLVPAIAAEQAIAAAEGASYVGDALAEQGTWVAPSVFADTKQLAGWAPDGRTLQGLLASPAFTALSLIGGGMAPGLAMERAGRSLDQIMTTLMADTSRQAAAIDVAARPGVGWVRMINPPSCSRCVILAGRFYRWNDGFLRHPKCFPASVVVSGPGVDAATRRWYEGELVILRTAAGKELSITGNHPVLTDQGWVPANLVQVGDRVVRATRTEGATPLVVPDEQQSPALIEDVWSSSGMVTLGEVPTTPEDFHGDGMNGQVDVVLADRLLRNGREAAGFELATEPFLAGGSVLAAGLDGERTMSERLAALAGSPDRGVGGGGLLFPLLGGHLGGTDETGFGHGAYRYASGFEASADDVAGHLQASADRILALAGLVGRGDLLVGQGELLPRWDAPAVAFSAEDSGEYSRVGRDLLQRLTGQVELDRVIEVERVSWSGHVYNLTSSEGWFSANGLIVSNCDCIHRPADEKSLEAARREGLVTDPYEYFRSLSAKEQARIFTKAGAQAINDGADMGRVLNARRGMTENGMFTTEGMGKRGFARKNLGPRQRRMTPEAIYKLNPNRADALAELEKHGYILPGGQNPLGAIKGASYEGYGELGRGGTRKGATQAVLDARASGVRTGSRYTMTAAERRLFDAQQQWQAVMAGRNPWGKTPLTPQIAAAVEKNVKQQLATRGHVFTRTDTAAQQLERIVIRGR